MNNLLVIYIRIVNFSIMKTNFYRVMVLMLGLSVSFVAYSQNASDDVEYQKFLKHQNDRYVEKQKIFEYQKGGHYGVELSFADRTEGWEDYDDYSWEVSYYTSYEIGVNAFYGKRFSEYWMLIGSVGVDYRKSSYSWDKRVSEYTWETFYGEDNIIGIPVVGEGRFYFGTARCMPFVHASAGIHISKSIGYLYNFGFGLDYNYSKSNTVYLALGFGKKTMPCRVFEKRQPTDKFHTVDFFPRLNIKVGFYF